MALTRIRIEASGSTPEEVYDDLVSAADHFKGEHAGEWGFTGSPMQTTKNGFWSFGTLENKEHDFSGDKRRHHG